jgi:hypothetical protein
MADIVIHHHLGLGDHIDCNGMVRYFADLYEDDVIHTFAKEQYFDMIEWMYRDEEQIKVHKIQGNEYAGVYNFMKENDFSSEDLYIVGHGNYPTNPSPDKNCWEYFYEQLGIDLDIKQDFFYVEPDDDEEKRVFDKLNPTGEDYVFVHDDPARGFSIDIENNLKIIRNDISENIFNFAKIIEKAKEIHLMESSFKSMVEHYPTKGKLFFHDFREHPLGKHEKDWTVIEYD